MSSSDALKADLTLVVVTMLAAVGWIFSKESLAGMAPLTFMFVRFCGAGLILAAVGSKQLLGLSADGWRGAIRSGLCFGIAMVFWILGLEYGQHLGVGAFLTSLGVVLVPLTSWMMGMKPPRSSWVSLVIAISGLACLSLDGEFVFGWGELSFLMSALSFSITFVLTSRASAKTPAIALSAIQLTLVGMVAVPIMLLMDDWRLPATAVTWGWVLASLLIATCLRFFLQVWAQGQTTASAAAVIMVLEPVWTAILAAFWFGESSSGMQLLGCSLIFTALLASRWRALLKVLTPLLPNFR
ncbi:DMT family transporter [Oceanobacter mangrovi]|uniref:DMT family transporter n=1 Tax=Oceanobacter mangrovi TaxID=2862510 RepID=UPI001C8E71C0|nr:DMT family transporter [Oceanobacter mangrovi]